MVRGRTDLSSAYTEKVLQKDLSPAYIRRISQQSIHNPSGQITRNLQKGLLTSYAEGLPPAYTQSKWTIHQKLQVVNTKNYKKSLKTTKNYEEPQRVTKGINKSSPISNLHKGNFKKELAAS